MKPHKHAELIKAWADGAVIEHNNGLGYWIEQRNPQWNEWDIYRIKFEPKPDREEIMSVYSNLLYQHNPSGLRERSFMEGNYRFLADMKLIFDGETGELKSAEVLK